MKRLNRAFTLTELLVALGVIAILCTILMPMIFHAMPNQNEMMMKKAFYATQTIVSELINDDNCYPDKTNLSGSDNRIGFADGFGYPNCDLWGGSKNTGTITTEGSCEQKFARLFFNKLPVIEDIPNEFTFRCMGPGCTETKITTSDGMIWDIAFSPENGFKPSYTNSPRIILHVDVNGDEGPNSTGPTELNECPTANFDKIKMFIYRDGSITIDNVCAKEAVKVNRNIVN